MPVLAIKRDLTTEVFFAGTARGELPIRRCRECGHFNPPQSGGCSRCESADLEWVPASGLGRVVSWSVVHGRAGAGGPAPREVVAIVELDEGPWLHAQVHGVEPDAVVAGLRVRVDFEQPEGGEAIPVFRVAG